jgi:acetyltransferase-like isoleucine patch superfamily enzyme
VRETSQMKSLLQALGAFPFLALAALTAGLSAAPGVYVFHQLHQCAQGLPPHFFYPAIGMSLVFGYITYGLSLIFVAPLLNQIFGGRLKPYKGKQVSLGILPWYIHATFTMLPRLSFLPFVCTTPIINLYYRMMGMKMGDNVVINTTAIADPGMIELGERVTLGGSCSIMAHYAQGGYMVIAPTKIGSGATIGLRAIVMGGVEVGEKAKVMAGSFVLPKTVIPAGELWGGIPAVKIERESRHES